MCLSSAIPEILKTPDEFHQGTVKTLEVCSYISRGLGRASKLTDGSWFG